MLEDKPPEDQPWSMYREDNVVVGVLPEGAAVDLGNVKPLRERYERIVTEADVDAHVAVMHSKDPMDDPILEQAEKSARAGVQHGLERWAIVAPTIKQLAMRNKVDIPELEVYATEDFEEALAWAKGKRPEAETF